MKPLLVPQDEVGYYPTSVPSMVFYLRRPIYEEYDADPMVPRLQSARRVFCILSGEDFDYLVRDRKLVLHLLDRRPRLVTRLRNLPDESGRLRQDLLLVSNYPVPQTPDTETLDAP
ncbi:MAG: hypothetical protein HXY20_01565 [Acidobacteria bacterium]|nr:hypothetical protein [Acidobacteriota bacterium]